LDKRKIETDAAPAAIGPYSQGMGARGGCLLFVSGQLGIDPATGTFSGESVEAQTERAIKNLLAVVDAAGGGRASIVKTTVFLKDLADFPRMNEVYSRLLGEPYPARSCVGVLALPKNGLVEIEAVAVLET
jgi:2-iminobutanoate/2-iminopropanoate deaminase